MRIDIITSQAIRHTLHCLAGCSIGEVSGMAIGSSLKWHGLASTALAIVLAFFFGYLFTFYSLARHNMEKTKAIKTAVATDTVSITSMEIIDNIIIWLIPGALTATLASWLFWESLAIALFVAFWVTVLVNRWLIKRSHGSNHMYH